MLGPLLLLLCAGGESPTAAERLVHAYPAHLAAAQRGHIVWRDGFRMAFDDGSGPKTHQQKLAAADLQEQMEQPYPLGPASPPVEDFEPGRIRSQPFFDRMYGSTTAEVEANLVDLEWMIADGGRTLRVTRVNEIDQRLAAVAREIAVLPVASRRCAAATAGAYARRRIAGTERWSMHAYGAALDIDPACGDYWRWREPGRLLHDWKNRVPLDVVEAFERHRFLWGGKWYRYDSMHFEYRPELIDSDQNGAAASPHGREEKRP